MASLRLKLCYYAREFLEGRVHPKGRVRVPILGESIFRSIPERRELCILTTSKSIMRRCHWEREEFEHRLEKRWIQHVRREWCTSVRGRGRWGPDWRGTSDRGDL